MRAKTAQATDIPGDVIDARLVLRVLSDVKKGQLGTRLPAECEGLPGKVYDTLNDILKQHQGLLESNDRLSVQARSLERKNLEVERTGKTLREKLAQLTRTSKHKSEFLANMSHELRTPLNSMLILSKLLAEADDGLSIRQREYARTIHSAGADLLELINEILDLSKIEAGMMEVEIERVILTDLRDYVERTFREVAQSRGLDFKIFIEESAPELMHTDQRRLQQILKNLLSNAFKFTEQGSVTLCIRQASSGWSSDRKTLNASDAVIAFSVTDTGIGIPPEKHEIIFDAFQQADGSTSRRYGGTGLGLSISRKISHLLGGELRLTGSYETGSTFTLYLPPAFTPNRRKRVFKPTGTIRTSFARGQNDVAPTTGFLGSTLGAVDQRKPVSAISLNDPVLLGKKVLVIDDDMRNIFAITSLLERYNMNVLYAETGKDGIELLKKHSDADIVLIDIMMPHINGFEVMHRIRDIETFRRLPMIALTAKAMKGDREKCVEAGASDYVSKPADNEKLLSVLRAWLVKDLRHGGPENQLDE